MAIVGSVLALLVFLCVKSEVIDDRNFSENYTPHIWGILNYFNSNPDRIYNYSVGALESAQKTDGGLFLRIEVKVECRLNPTDPRCGHTIHTCEAFVQYNEAIDRYEILPGASCHPKFEGTEQSAFLGEPQVKSSSVLQLNEEPTASVHLNHDAAPEGNAGEEFVAVRRDSNHCLGCVIDLDRNVEGLPALVTTALKHIESESDRKHVLLNVLKVQQQVVAGIKYILLLEIAPTVCTKDVNTITPELCPVDQNVASRVCHVIYLQKPWISLQKHIIANNCTNSQEFTDVNKAPVFPQAKHPTIDELENEIDITNNFNNYPSDDVDYNNVANGVPNFDVIANTGHFDSDNSGINLSLLSDIESQIEVEKPRATPSQAAQEDSSVNVQKLEKTDINLENKNIDGSKSENLESGQEEVSAEKNSNEIQRQEEVNLDFLNAANSEVPSSVSSLQMEDSGLHLDEGQVQLKETVLPESALEKHDRKKRSVSKYSFKKNSSYNKHWFRKLASYAVKEKLGLENHHVLEVLYPKQDKSKKTEGLLYSFSVKVKTIDSGITEMCKTKILIPQEKSEKKILKFKCYDSNKKSNKKLSRTPRQATRPGGIWEVSVTDPEITSLAQSSLLQLNLNSGEDNKFKVVEVLSAKKQVVAGLLYRIKAKLILTQCDQNGIEDPQQCIELEGEKPRVCDITVWNRPWLPNGRQTNITCENDENQYSFLSKRSIPDSETEDAHEESNNNDYDSPFYLFDNFLKTYNKKYETKREHKYRFKVFRDNLKKIHLLNKYEQGTAKYGITVFADLTHDEFKQYKGLRPDLKSNNDIENQWAEIPNITLPIEFDWRTKNAVTEVKNQGSCGSCWAFSVTGNVEGQYAIKHGKLLEFSEQELVDCDTTDEGCNGGYMTNAYRAIEKLGGLETENDYPYEGDNEACHFRTNLVQVELSGALNISSNETDMAKWLVKNGPISIGINANAMQFYVGGVSHPWKFMCDPKNLDHGVLIVGYGVHKYPYLKKTLPYWIVKNSWGRSWGEQGYYLVYRGDGTCGLNLMASSAIVE